MNGLADRGRFRVQIGGLPVNLQAFGGEWAWSFADMFQDGERALIRPILVAGRWEGQARRQGMPNR